MAHLMKIYLLALCLILMYVNVHADDLVDSNENCEFWASTGECDKNPNYMLSNCAYSCQYNRGSQDIQPLVNSIYEIEETDINGNPVYFENFQGKVIYVVNVASRCGYTQSNYELMRNLRQYIPMGLQLIIAPCNQFAGQEPGDKFAIANFADKQGFEGVILSKGNVNGAQTRPLFEYLKSVTGKHYIAWNFDGKFLVDRVGNIYKLESDDDVESKIVELLQSQEL